MILMMIVGMINIQYQMLRPKVDVKYCRELN